MFFCTDLPAGTTFRGGPTVEKAAEPLFRESKHASWVPIPCRKVGPSCVRGVISEVDVYKRQAHYMMAYANMFKRDVTRLEDCLERLDECPLGAGALATSTYPVDRFATAQALGFKKPTDNSMDSVSDRDYVIELLSALSILMMHLSRFSEEIILWCSWEFKFVDLDDAYSTGSSIMPQKKNPDVAELVRGKTGRVYGSLITLLTIMKGCLLYTSSMARLSNCAAACLTGSHWASIIRWL